MNNKNRENKLRNLSAVKYIIPKKILKKLTPVRVVLALAVVVFLVILGHAAWGQAAAPGFAPTPNQLTRLQLAQKDAIIAQLLLNQAEKQRDDANASLNAAGEAVRVENKWPDTVHFNPQTLTYFDMPKLTPAPVPAKTPEPAKKP